MCSVLILTSSCHRSICPLLQAAVSWFYKATTLFHTAMSLLLTSTNTRKQGVLLLPFPTDFYWCYAVLHGSTLPVGLPYAYIPYLPLKSQWKQKGAACVGGSSLEALSCTACVGCVHTKTKHCQSQWTTLSRYSRQKKNSSNTNVSVEGTLLLLSEEVFLLPCFLALFSYQWPPPQTNS